MATSKPIVLNVPDMLVVSNVANTVEVHGETVSFKNVNLVVTNEGDNVTNIPTNDATSMFEVKDGGNDIVVNALLTQIPDSFKTAMRSQNWKMPANFDIAGIIGQSSAGYGTAFPGQAMGGIMLTRDQVKTNHYINEWLAKMVYDNIVYRYLSPADVAGLPAAGQSSYLQHMNAVTIGSSNTTDTTVSDSVYSALSSSLTGNAGIRKSLYEQMFTQDPVRFMTGGASDIKSTLVSSTSGATTFNMPNSGTTTYSTPSSMEYNFGSGDFTLEFWFKWSGTNPASNQPRLITNTRGTWALNTWTIGMNDNAIAFWAHSRSFFQSSITISANVWYHVAFTRSGNTLFLYVNGVLDKTVVYGSNSFDDGVTSRVLTIGGGPGMDQYFYGDIEQVQVTKGTPKYIENFSPPLRTVLVGNNKALEVSTDKLLGRFTFNNTLVDLTGNYQLASSNATGGIDFVNNVDGTNALVLNNTGSKFGSFLFENSLKSSQLDYYSYKSELINAINYPPAAWSNLGTSSTTLSGLSYGNGTYVVSASVGGTTANLPFDGDNATKWTASTSYDSTSGAYTGATSTTVSGSAVAGDWIQLELPSAIAITSYLIGVDNVSRPVDFRLAGSNDGTTWTLVDLQSSVSFPTPEGCGMTFNCAYPASYTRYRLIITKKNAGANALAIVRWSLLQTSGNVVYTTGSKVNASGTTSAIDMSANPAGGDSAAAIVLQSTTYYDLLGYNVSGAQATVSVLAKFTTLPSSGSYSTILSMDVSGSAAIQDGFAISYINNVSGFTGFEAAYFIGNNTWVKSQFTTTAQTGVWYKLTATISNNAVILYLNDAQVASIAFTYPASGQTTSLSRLVVGARTRIGYTCAFCGQIDEIFLNAGAVPASLIPRIGYTQVSSVKAPSITLSTGYTQSLWVKFKSLNDMNRHYVTYDDNMFVFADKNMSFNWQNASDVMEAAAATDTGFRFAVSNIRKSYRDPLTVDKWYHLVISGNTTSGSFYIDGTRVGGWTASDNVADCTIKSLQFGREYFSSCFDGEIGNVDVWNRTLSAAEVTDLYNYGRPPTFALYAPSFRKLPFAPGDELRFLTKFAFSKSSNTASSSLSTDPQSSLVTGVTGYDIAQQITTSWTGYGNTQQFVSVAASPTTIVAGNLNGNVFYSTNGTTWTQRNISLTCNAMCWSPQLGLFVVVSSTSSSGRNVMTSPDGITWTLQTSPNMSWKSVCWSPELNLLVAVANGGTGNRVMTSPDGINWTSRTAPTMTWTSVCWSAEKSLFVAVANGSTSTNRVMSSPDGINWTSRDTPGNQGVSWTSVCWSPEKSLFVAVADGSSSSRVMTSPDGITWTPQSPFGSTVAWGAVTWVSDLGVFIAGAGANDTTSTSRIMLSQNGIDWVGIATPSLPPATHGVSAIAWSATLKVLVLACNGSASATPRIMVSARGDTSAVTVGGTKYISVSNKLMEALNLYPDDRVVEFRVKFGAPARYPPVAPGLPQSSYNSISLPSSYQTVTSIGTVGMQNLMGAFTFNNNMVDYARKYTMTTSTTGVDFSTSKSGQPCLTFTNASPGSTLNITASSVSNPSVPITGGITVSVWGNMSALPATNTWTAFYRFANGFGNYGLVLYYVNNQSSVTGFRATYQDASGVYKNAVVSMTATTNTWYNLVVTLTQTNMSLYVNNGSPTSVALTSNTQSLGALTIGEGLAGAVDDLFIWNRVLTAAEIAALAALSPVVESAYSSPVSSTGLVGAFPFNNNAVDYAKNYTVTPTNITYTTLRNGQPCATYSGASLTSTVHPTLPLSGGVTIAFWVMMSSLVASNGVTYIAQLTNTSGSNNGILFSNGWSGFTGFFAQYNDGTTLNQARSSFGTTNTWYHLAATFSNTAVSFYVNGTLVSTATYSTTQSFTTFTSGGSLTGAIDDLLIFNRVLSTAEIATLAYQNTASLVETMTVPSTVSMVAPNATTETWKTFEMPTSYQNIPTSALPSGVGSTSLKGMFSFNNNVTDYTRNYALTNTSTTFTTTRNSQNCATFTTGSKLESIVQPSMPLSSSVSISMWVNMQSFPTSGNEHQLVTLNTTSTSSGTLKISYRNNLVNGYGNWLGFYADYWDNANNQLAVATQTAASTNTWYHLAVILKTNAVDLYVNGTSIGTRALTTTHTASANTSKVTLGLFNGAMDDLLIFNRAIAPAEITALYNASATSFTETTVSAPVATTSLSGAFTFNNNVMDYAGGYTLTTTSNVAYGTLRNNLPSLTFTNASPGTYPGTVLASSTANPSLAASNGVTMACWVNFSTLPTGLYSSIARLLTSFTDTNGLQLVYFNNVSGRTGIVAQFQQSNGSFKVVPTAANVLANTWYHVCTTVNSSSVSLYVNGVLVSSQAIDVSISGVNLTGLCVGEGLAGAVDDLLIFGRVLTNDEILTLAASSALHVYKSLTTSAIPLPIPSTNLVGALTFNDNMIFDFANNYTLTPTNVTFTTTRNGLSCATVTGNGKLESTTNPSSLSITNGITFSAWVSMASLPANNGIVGIMGFENGYTDKGGLTLHYMTNYFGTTGFQARYQVSSGVFKYATWSNTAVAGQWYHLCLTLTGTNMTFYVNGVVAQSTDFGVTNSSSLGLMTLCNGINGAMDDVLIFNRTLSSSEVLALSSMSAIDELKNTYEMVVSNYAYNAPGCQLVNGRTNDFWHTDDKDTGPGPAGMSDLKATYDRAMGMYRGTNSFNGVPGEWFVLKLNAPVVAKSYKIYARDNFQDYRSPREYVLFGSNDNVTYNIIDDKRGANRITTSWGSTNGSFKTFDISSNNASYLYYAMVISSVGLENATNNGSKDKDSVQIAEFEIFDSSSKKYPTALLPYTAATRVSASRWLTTTGSYGNGFYSARSSSTYYDAANSLIYHPYRAFDGNSATTYASEANYAAASGIYSGSATLGGVSGEWLSFQTPTPIVLKSYAITPRSDAVGLARVPQEFVLLGSNDGVTWATIDDRLDTRKANGWTNAQRQFFVMENSTAYSWYAIVVKTIGNSNLTSSRDVFEITQISLADSSYV